MTEAALLTSGLPLESPGTESNYGLVKLLIEARVQFDILEPAAAWERYGLVVLPDFLEVNDALAARLHRYVAEGGAVLAIHRSGVLQGSEKSWLERYGLSYAGLSPFKPAYLLPGADWTSDIPRYEYALYDGASQWRAAGAARVLANLGEPAFQRSPEHYTSHAQSPFDHATEFAAAAESGSVGLVAFPLGAGYYNHGYWVYRRAFERVVRDLLPVPLVRSNAPLSAELTVTHQAAKPGVRPERYLVHVVNFSALRGTPKHPEFYEDPVPLTDVRVTVNLPRRPATARAVIAGADLRLGGTGPAVEVTLTRVAVHEVISLNLL